MSGFSGAAVDFWQLETADWDHILLYLTFYLFRDLMGRLSVSFDLEGYCWEKDAGTLKEPSVCAIF